MRKRLLPLIALPLLLSCSVNRQVETDLYFGFSKPAGGQVTTAEWNQFMERYISPVFFHGFTVIDAQGKWLDDSTHRLISEPSVLLVAIHANNKHLSKRIDSISENYKRIFEQQAVLRVDKGVRIKLKPGVKIRRDQVKFPAALQNGARQGFRGIAVPWPLVNEAPNIFYAGPHIPL